MIIAKIYKDKEGYIRRYSINGHSNYAEYGNDIVCAGVSALTQTVLISLVKVCKIEENTIRYKIDDKTGFLDVSLPEDIEAFKLENSQILLKSLVVGINSMIESYPDYINLEYRRCSDD
jgi:uncharacterized protein